MSDGAKLAPNNVRWRPASGTKGDRVSIPRNGTKPPETLHWADPPTVSK